MSKGHFGLPEQELSKDIMVEISFLLPEDGGRTKSILSGYRPQFFYKNYDWDVRHTYLDVEEVKPGETVKAILTFLSPQEHWGKLKVSDHFLIREGRRIVGFGHVIEILELEESAKRMADISKL